MRCVEMIGGIYRNNVIIAWMTDDSEGFNHFQSDLNLKKKNDFFMSIDNLW